MASVLNSGSAARAHQGHAGPPRVPEPIRAAPGLGGGGRWVTGVLLQQTDILGLGRWDKGTFFFHPFLFENRFLAIHFQRIFIYGRSYPSR